MKIACTRSSKLSALVWFIVMCAVSSVVVSCVVVVVLLLLSWWLLVAHAGAGVAVAPGVNLTPAATVASAPHYCLDVLVPGAEPPRIHWALVHLYRCTMALGAGGAWCVGHDLVARFVLLFFSFLFLCVRENMKFFPHEPLNRRF
jgi:hypothetical protein